MATNGAAPTVYYASRPRLRLDGELMQELGESLLQSLFVEESTLGLFRCEASFINWGPKDGQVGYLFFDRRTLDFGKTLAVEFGPPGEAGPVFAGRISGLEASFPSGRPPEFLILAEDRFQDLRMERRTRTFEDMTDADVIRQVASQHGLSAQVDVDGPTYRLLAQLNQSDLAFLRERAAAVDAELWLDDRTIYVQARTPAQPRYGHLHLRWRSPGVLCAGRSGPPAHGGARQRLGRGREAGHRRRGQQQHCPGRAERRSGRQQLAAGSPGPARRNALPWTCPYLVRRPRRWLRPTTGRGLVALCAARAPSTAILACA